MMDLQNSQDTQVPRLFSSYTRPTISELCCNWFNHNIAGIFSSSEDWLEDLSDENPLPTQKKKKSKRGFQSAHSQQNKKLRRRRSVRSSTLAIVSAQKKKQHKRRLGNAGSTALLSSLATLFMLNGANADLNTGSVLHWSFDGNTNDLAGYGNDGVPINNPSYVTDRNNNLGGALEFNGVNQYVSLLSPNGLPVGSDPRAISLWFKWSAVVRPEPAIEIMGYGPNQPDRRLGVAIEHTQPGERYLGVENLGSFRGFPWGGDTDWHHLAVVYPEGEVTTDKFKIYFDGALQNCTNVFPPHALNTGGAPMTVGCLPEANVYYFNGAVDDLRMFNCSKTDSEIQALYDEGKTSTSTSTTTSTSSTSTSSSTTTTTTTTRPIPTSRRARTVPTSLFGTSVAVSLSTLPAISSGVGSVSGGLGLLPMLFMIVGPIVALSFVVFLIVKALKRRLDNADSTDQQNIELGNESSNQNTSESQKNQYGASPSSPVALFGGSYANRPIQPLGIEEQYQCTPDQVVSTLDPKEEHYRKTPSNV